jgi:DDE superfamily endonuclease/Homeodomain-like domain
VIVAVLMVRFSESTRMPRPLAHPLRPLTPAEQQALDQILRAPSQPLRRHQRAQALLAIAAGSTLTAAATAVGWRVGDTVGALIRRFNVRGLAALDDQPRPGRRPTYTAAARARILREVRRPPDREQDGTATWSLSTLQRALRRAPDGLPHVSTFTILQTLHEAGYTWQQSRTWCDTGVALRKRKHGVDRVEDPHTGPKQEGIERAYRVGETLGLPVWCEDEAGPYQAIPHAGASWQPTGHPVRQPHEYARGGTAKLLTLFRPATGEVRGEPVEQTTNAILHPWLERELEAILASCPPTPAQPAAGCRWVDWDWQPSAAHLDRFLPPIRMLLVLDNLSGHCSHSFVEWCMRRGICLLYTPLAGSWLNMAESVQRIIVRRALAGQHPHDTTTLKQWLQDTVAGWNRAPTPFIWGGKRQARRDRAYARRHRLGGSGATTISVVPRRTRPVRQHHVPSSIAS